MSPLLILAAVFLGVLLIGLGLARAAALGDEQLGYKEPSSPLSEYTAERQEKAKRALVRAGISRYPIVVPTGRTRLGIDKRDG